MTPEEIGITIRTRRKQLRLTQGQLAELASCSKPSVIAAEAGKPTLRMDKLRSILSILGLSLSVQPEERDR
jgi:HTH-type transcriptional regulator / antitoxin HipB